MKKYIAMSTGAAFSFLLTNVGAQNSPLNFTGTVGMVQVQTNVMHPSHPNMLVLTILDSGGGRIKFCNSAQYPWSLAIATTNANASSIQQTVTQAKTAGQSVTGTASEVTSDSDGLYCGIQGTITAQQ